MPSSRCCQLPNRRKSPALALPDTLRRSVPEIRDHLAVGVQREVRAEPVNRGGPHGCTRRRFFCASVVDAAAGLASTELQLGR